MIKCQYTGQSACIHHTHTHTHSCTKDFKRSELSPSDGGWHGSAAWGKAFCVCEGGERVCLQALCACQKGCPCAAATAKSGQAVGFPR